MSMNPSSKFMIEPRKTQVLTDVSKNSGRIFFILENSLTSRYKDTADYYSFTLW